MTYRIVTPETFDARDIERAIEAGEVVTLHYPDRDERRARFIERDDPRLPAPGRQPGENPAGSSTSRSRRIVSVPPPGPPLWFTERPWTRSGVFAERGERVVERALWLGLGWGVVLLVVVQLWKWLAR